MYLHYTYLLFIETRQQWQVTGCWRHSCRHSYHHAWRPGGSYQRLSWEGRNFQSSRCEFCWPFVWGFSEFTPTFAEFEQSVLCEGSFAAFAAPTNQTVSVLETAPPVCDAAYSPGYISEFLLNPGRAHKKIRCTP